MKRLSFITSGVVAGLILTGCVNNNLELPKFKKTPVVKMKKMSFEDLAKKYPINHKDKKIIINVNCYTLKNYLKQSDKKCDTNELSKYLRKIKNELKDFCLAKDGRIEKIKKLNVYGRWFNNVKLCKINNKLYFGWKLNDYYSISKKNLRIFTPLAFHPQKIDEVLLKMGAIKKDGYYIISKSKFDENLYLLRLAHSKLLSIKDNLISIPLGFVPDKEKKFLYKIDTGFFAENLAKKCLGKDDFDSVLKMKNILKNKLKKLLNSNYALIDIDNYSLSKIVIENQQYYLIKNPTKFQKEQFLNAQLKCDIVNSQKFEDLEY